MRRLFPTCVWGILIQFVLVIVYVCRHALLMPTSDVNEQRRFIINDPAPSLWKRAASPPSSAS